jgi:hypothetical protein
MLDEERRDLAKVVARLEIRKDDDGNERFDGHAAVFDQRFRHLRIEAQRGEGGGQPALRPSHPPFPEAPFRFPPRRSQQSWRSTRRTRNRHLKRADRPRTPERFAANGRSHRPCQKFLSFSLHYNSNFQMKY